MKRNIDVRDLRIGMYVAELDRPWLETPFLFQGFPIRSSDEIAQLQACCKHVYVDLELSSADIGPEHERGASATSHTLSYRQATEPLPHVTVGPEASDAQRHGRENASHRGFETHRLNFGDAKVGDPVLVPFHTELKAATWVYQKTKAHFRRLMEEVRLGESIDPEGARQVVNEMVDSIVKNENALVWLTHLKNRDEYTSLHSLNVCILSLLFGRHLGMDIGDLRELGFGALLHDIGKMRVPLEVLNKTERLTSDDIMQLKRHPEHGRNILNAAVNVPPSAVDVAYSHHERADGSGYPRGLAGDDISCFAMIVSVVDVYDAITSDRVYHMGISPHEALNAMYGWAPKKFPKELLEEFIRCLGIYPIGSIVELGTGEVGVVMTVNRRTHLRPIVTLVLDREKKPYPVRKLLDLELQSQAGAPISIRKILASAAYGIDVPRIIREDTAA